MPTNRTPTIRRAAAQVTPRAVELFIAMCRLKCTCPPPGTLTEEEMLEHDGCPGCIRWYELHSELHRALQLAPWQWPCVVRASPKRAGSLCTMDDEIAARMELLREAGRSHARNLKKESPAPW